MALRMYSLKSRFGEVSILHNLYPCQSLTTTVVYKFRDGTSLLKLEVVIQKKRPMALVKDLIHLIAQGDYSGTLLQYQS
jgi:hypothetical protein